MPRPKSINTQGVIDKILDTSLSPSERLAWWAWVQAFPPYLFAVYYETRDALMELALEMSESRFPDASEQRKKLQENYSFDNERIFLTPLRAIEKVKDLSRPNEERVAWWFWLLKNYQSFDFLMGRIEPDDLPYLGDPAQPEVTIPRVSVERIMNILSETYKLGYKLSLKSS